MQQRATQVDVAREAGVSRALVSIHFRGLPGVSPVNRELISSAARKLNYRPNKLASQLASRGADSVGVYFLNFTNELFADIYEGVHEILGSSDTSLVLSISPEAGGNEESAIDALIEARVGVVIATGLLVPDAVVQRIAEHIPVVSVSRHVPGIDSVYPDDELGGELATRHLLELGHRRILHLANPQRDGYTGRRRGYLNAMRSAGLEPRILESDYSRESAAVAIGPALDSPDRPTAIFANNDQTALGVLEAVHQRGLRCPDDVSLVGYDNTRTASSPGIRLTSVDIRARELGRRGALAAQARLGESAGEPIDDCLAPALTIRNSTRRL